MTVELALVANAGENTLATFQLTPFGLQRLTVTALPGRCTTFAVDANRSLVFAACGNSIVTYALAATGELTALSTRETPSGSNYLALTTDGTRLLGVSYGGNWGLVWPVDTKGTLSAPSAEVSFPKLHSVAVSNDGRTAYFVSLGADLIAPRFEDTSPAGKRRIVSFYAKRARGAMARWLVRERVRSVKALYEFDADGYRYAPERSTPAQPTYVRVAA